MHLALTIQPPQREFLRANINPTTCISCEGSAMQSNLPGTAIAAGFFAGADVTAHAH